MVNIAGGIILYNPDLKRLKENITAVINQVELLFIVDNGSKNINLIENYFVKTKKIR